MPGIKDLNRMSQAELAMLWDISTRTIQRKPEWETLRHGSGQGSYYVWSECRQFELAQTAALSQAADPESLSDRQRREKAEADLAEMRRDEAGDGLLDAQEVVRVWIAFLGRLKDNLLGLADRAAPEIEQTMTLAERIAIIRRHVNGSLRDVVAELTTQGEQVGQ